MVEHLQFVESIGVGTNQPPHLLEAHTTCSPVLRRFLRLGEPSSRFFNLGNRASQKLDDCITNNQVHVKDCSLVSLFGKADIRFWRVGTSPSVEGIPITSRI